MFKYIEALFHHWIRFVALIIVLPALAGGASLYLFQGKTGSTQIWVDNPSYFGTVSTASGWNQYLTPAQNTVDSLDQLVATQSYYDQLGKRLMADRTVHNTTERDQVLGEVASQLKITSNGSHLIDITVDCPTANVCIDVLNTTVSMHRDWLIENERNQAAVASQFYTGQLQLAQDRVTQAVDKLNTYVAGHPTPQVLVKTPDPALDRLQSDVNSAQSQVNGIQDKMQNIQFSAEAAGQIDQTAVRTIDPPRVKSGRFTSTTKKMAMIIGGGAVLPGLLYLFVLGWLDRTARSSKEIEARLGVRVVSTIGNLLSEKGV
jgi:capsular polysaccharide biosynthesis protein